MTIVGFSGNSPNVAYAVSPSTVTSVRAWRDPVDVVDDVDDADADDDADDAADDDEADAPTMTITDCDADGNTTGYADVFTRIEAYAKHFEAVGLGRDYVKTFIR